MRRFEVRDDRLLLDAPPELRVSGFCEEDVLLHEEKGGGIVEQRLEMAGCLIPEAVVDERISNLSGQVVHFFVAEAPVFESLHVNPGIASGKRPAQVPQMETEPPGVLSDGCNDMQHRTLNYRAREEGPPARRAPRVPPQIRKLSWKRIGPRYVSKPGALTNPRTSTVRYSPRLVGIS